MEESVRLFNELPRPKRAASKIVENRWHFTFRHVDIEPAGDMVFIVNLASSFVVMSNPLHNLGSLSEADAWRERALALVDAFVTKFPGPGKRPFAWVTDSTDTAAKIEKALRDIGIGYPLDRVRSCGEPGNGKATRLWQGMRARMAGRSVLDDLTDHPRILLLSLEHQDFFDEQYTGLIDRLASIATLQRAKTSSAALRILQRNPPPTVLVTDAGIARQENSAVLDALATFVNNGGNLAIAGHFSTFTNATDMERVFSAFELPWKSADYLRTDVEYRSPLGNISPERVMPRKYSQKAVFLKDVDTASCLWTYQPAQNARTQSLVFSPSSVPNDMCAAVCFSNLFGFVSYLGDVNNEVESTAMVIRMCQL